MENKKFDRSQVFIDTWYNGNSGAEYYATQLIFFDKTLLKEWDMEDEPTGYYALITNDGNPLFSDIKLLIPCTRRSQRNYELSMEKFPEVVHSSIEVMERDRKLMRDAGVTDNEIDDMIRKIREAYENEINKLPMISSEPVKKDKNKEEKKDKKKVVFDDVAGMTEVKDVLLDVIDQLNNPDKYELFDIEPIRSLLMYGKPGCVDKDTEYFNGTKWVKMDEYKEGDKVLIYAEDGKARLELPQRYIKEYCEEMTLVTNSSGSINQCLSNDHRVMYTSLKTMKPNFIKFDEFKEQYQKNKNGFNGYILSAFEYENKGIELTDDEIRVQIMTMADGHFNKFNTTYCTLRLKKERKIERAKELLKKANIEYKVHLDTKNNFTVIYYYAPRKEKVFGDFWYDCNKHQFEVILDECLKWDGSEYENRKQFHTTIKENADFIQFVSSSLGKRSTICERDRRGKEKETNGKTYQIKSKEYIVRLTNQNKLGLTAKKNRPRLNFTNYKTKDGFKYCFTVSTGMLVLRRNGRIFITGNCGKTYIANAFANMIDANFVKVNMGDIASKYQGQTGNNIKKIFDQARASDKFTVLFWDEIDAVANRRGADENSKEKNATLNVLLTEMSSEDNENIFMIFATNFVELLDPAFLRSKRCDIKIEIPLPNFETRLQVLELNSKKKPLGEDVNLEEVAERMEGMNCADVSLLCNQSARTALKKGKMEINQEDFLEALEKMNGSKKEEFKPKKIGFESQVVVVND